jgi:hypothetical protein
MEDKRELSIKVTVKESGHVAHIETDERGKATVSFWAGSHQLRRNQVDPDVALLANAVVSGIADRNWIDSKHRFVGPEVEAEVE